MLTPLVLLVLLMRLRWLMLLRDAPLLFAQKGMWTYQTVGSKTWTQSAHLSQKVTPAGSFV
jgi:hypothetical protein